MQETLLAAGVACLIAAVVGGGLKAFGIEIPALKSGIRQFVLGMLDIVLIVLATSVVGDGLTLSSSNQDPSPSSADNRSTPTGGGHGENSAQPIDEPAPDFPGGSERLYSAEFASWPMQSTEHGSVTLGFGNALVVKPTSNTWIGPGRTIGIPSVEGDFVCDVRFRIEERSPSAALHVRFSGAGNDAEAIDAYVSVWRDDRVTYTLNKARVRSGEGLAVPHVVTERVVADRVELPSEVSGSDWAAGGELTFKREGGVMQFFVNDTFVEEFDVSLFPVEGISLGAAFESTITITSMEFRGKP